MTNERWGIALILLTAGWVAVQAVHRLQANTEHAGPLAADVFAWTCLGALASVIGAGSGPWLALVAPTLSGLRRRTGLLVAGVLLLVVASSIHFVQPLSEAAAARAMASVRLDGEIPDPRYWSTPHLAASTADGHVDELISAGRMPNVSTSFLLGLRAGWTAAAAVLLSLVLLPRPAPSWAGVPAMLVVLLSARLLFGAVAPAESAWAPLAWTAVPAALAAGLVWSLSRRPRGVPAEEGGGGSVGGQASPAEELEADREPSRP